MTIEIPKLAVPGMVLAPEYSGKIPSIEDLNEPETGKDCRCHFFAGPGTRLDNLELGKENSTSQIPTITATVLGQVCVFLRSDEENVEAKKSENREYVVIVVPFKNNKIEYEDSQVPHISKKDEAYLKGSSLPQEGDIVLVRVTRISQRQANVEVLAVEGRGNVGEESGVGSNGSGAIASGGGSGASSFINAIATSASLIAQRSDIGETFKGIIRSQDVQSTNRDKVQINKCFRPGDVLRAIVISLGDGSNYYMSTARNDLGVILAKSNGGAGNAMYAVDWQTMIDPTTGVIEERKCAKPFS
ncbi:Exosome non-catalytic core component [Komagataella phaffii CBS 7435]|uniref:Subunit of the exosome, which is an essential complex present in both nucleus and cytoplasm n=2 Tax=Komagataella phaffii TaxID=460519 RepID=C4R899_KOMPG|nr:Subunit of the exosome, which is an essential complex present in both nucleus and cytoplasm [Komagataella phaffii GS115]AOA64498.1 GQ67_04933T0 [Komagataella phaffii]CAH2450782.1 Exosome non-catalytic core component [Komagataella phaffii CBS 7435]AOA70018.1 GQ68_04905T0 [Komagataella phaffii GS115]CAY71824.1 Subunit of the exosome, which is an essential complex present in both nucleus and cytoplasm [Komagataella phaffii GS115]CCA40576.1 Exosome non-catalytic core component [Komagataella pha